MATTEESVKAAFTEKTMEEMAKEPLIPPRDDFPDRTPANPTLYSRNPSLTALATFTRIRTFKDGKTLPQAIAHRGYRARYPENTMLSMRKAVEAGTHALETDTHLTRDGVVVLSHDPTLKRCFGLPDKIIDCDWNYISTLRSIGENPQPMPRLLDLLEFLSGDGLEELWVLLDIKMDNDADTVMRLIGETIKKAPANAKSPWNKRVVLGIWATKYLPLCAKYLPDFPISYIGFSTLYARQFLSVPNVSFNMLYAVLMGPLGNNFLNAVRKHDRAVFAWTVNDRKQMRWCIRKGLDGVVTDDPKSFLEVCEEFEKEEVGLEKWGWKELYMVMNINVLVLVFFWVFMWRFRVTWGVDKQFKRKGM